MEIASESLVRYASGVISNLSILEHVHKKKKWHVIRKTLTLFLQMSLLKVDSAL